MHITHYFYTDFKDHENMVKISANNRIGLQFIDPPSYICSHLDVYMHTHVYFYI